MKVHLEFDIEIDQEGVKRHIQRQVHATAVVLAEEAISNWEYLNLVKGVTWRSKTNFED